MPLYELKIENLVALDNKRIAEALNQAIRRAAAHCDDLPGVDAARKVSLNLNFTPVMDGEGRCETVNFEFEIVERNPKRKSKVYNGDLRKIRHNNGREECQVVFNDLSDDNANQNTFPSFEDDE